MSERITVAEQEGLLEEFSIMELEQRLEFEAWCDGNCPCDGPTTPPASDGFCPTVPIQLPSAS